MIKHSLVTYLHFLVVLEALDGVLDRLHACKLVVTAEDQNNAAHSEIEFLVAALNRMYVV